MPEIELDAAVQQVPADDAGAAAVVDHEPEREELLVDGHALGHPPLQLLVQHLDQHVPGDVGGVDRAWGAGGAERALVEPAFVVAREDGAPVLELVDVAGRLAREDLDRVLVAEVVGALDGVEGMRLRAVLGGVAERCVDAALGGARMAPRRVQLGDHADASRLCRAPRSLRACRRTRRRRRGRRALLPSRVTLPDAATTNAGVSRDGGWAAVASCNAGCLP